MDVIREFIVSGTQLSEAQLLNILRQQMLSEPDRRGWLQQTERWLDAYRTPAQQGATKLIKVALTRLSTELEA